MRVAVIVVSMLMVAAPSEASRSCMGKTEARQHFGSAHIYWHGADHCWDATPTRRYHQIHNVRKKIDEPKWHKAISECSYQAVETMPTDACQFFYECKGCGERLKPLAGDCCVFCSYGSVPCPPIQSNLRCCVPKVH